MRPGSDPKAPHDHVAFEGRATGSELVLRGDLRVPAALSALLATSYD